MIKNKKLSLAIICLSIVILVFNTLFTITITPSLFARQLSQLVSNQPAPVSSPTPASNYDRLVNQVAPDSGQTVHVHWGDMGQKLIASGAIDYDKFSKHYTSLTIEQEQILTGDNLSQITFTPENIQFWTNVLWSLGLTQQSKVLNEGLMMTRADQVPVANYAGTAGWTLGSKDAMDLYSSTNLIDLTSEQHDHVMTIAENIFRPCCGNHTAYPDCNHGMAVLGLLQLMVSQGASEEEMYQAALAFNSYAFTSTHITTAAYLEQQGTSWQDTTAKEILSSTYSSGQGASTIASAVGDIPGAPQKGASCGA